MPKGKGFLQEQKDALAIIGQYVLDMIDQKAKPKPVTPAERKRQAKVMEYAEQVPTPLSPAVPIRKNRNQMLEEAMMGMDQ
jgi:hypothetical protein